MRFSGVTRPKAANTTSPAPIPSRSRTAAPSPCGSATPILIVSTGTPGNSASRDEASQPPWTPAARAARITTPSIGQK